VTIDRATLTSILSELAQADYITMGRSTEEGAEREVVKIYPARLKRDFNLWHVIEDF
jgi:hypothetical protein